jgi:hypothetical protein
MTNGILDRQTLDEILTRVPSLDGFFDRVLLLSPDFISISFPPASVVPKAAVCLNDTLHMLADVRYALLEAHSHGIWYRRKGGINNERTATWMERFYTEDAAFRLYAAGEHLAAAITCMMELTEADLRAYRKNRVSKQAVVGQYLLKERPNLALTKTVVKLANASEWKSAMDYRANLVHEQPPTIHGLGIVYKRETRWADDDKTLLICGGGDKPDFKTDEVIKFMTTALELLIETFTVSLADYEEKLREAGCTPS